MRPRRALPVTPQAAWPYGLLHPRLRVVWSSFGSDTRRRACPEPATAVYHQLARQSGGTSGRGPDHHRLDAAAATGLPGVRSALTNAPTRGSWLTPSSRPRGGDRGPGCALGLWYAESPASANRDQHRARAVECTVTQEARGATHRNVQVWPHPGPSGANVTVAAVAPADRGVAAPPPQATAGITGPCPWCQSICSLRTISSCRANDLGTREN